MSALPGPAEYRTHSGHTVQAYLGGRGWRWWVLAGNGVIAAHGAQTYSRKDAALRAARRVLPAVTPEDPSMDTSPDTATVGAA